MAGLTPRAVAISLLVLARETRLRTLFSAAVSLDSHCFIGPVTVFASAIGPVPRSMLFAAQVAPRRIAGMLSSLTVESRFLTLLFL